MLFNVEAVLGFEDELVVEDDPEYHWTDSFRASRTSNSEREYLLYELAGLVFYFMAISYVRCMLARYG